MFIGYLTQSVYWLLKVFIGYLTQSVN